MNTEQIKECINQNANEVQEMLEQTFSYDEMKTKIIYDAARYSLLAGGKRIRPFLVRSFCQLFSGDDNVAMHFACGIEMIHTYSLIHDDLPCMDNDDLRRGKATNHKVYGENMALLAGDALLTQAFAEICVPTINHTAACNAIITLSRNAGVSGMIGGQVLDLIGENTKPDFQTLLKTHKMKTGALIEAACLMGCYAAGLEEGDERLDGVRKYAAGIGLTFQIIDDLLDQYSATQVLGKPIGSDKENDKTTFLTFMSAKEARAFAAKQTNDAINAIAHFPNNESLVSLAQYLLVRDH